MRTLLPALLLAACRTDLSPPEDVAELGCTRALNCASDEVCEDRVCTPALGRTYRVTVRSAEADAVTVDGVAWDADGPPDLFVDFGPVDAAGRTGPDACTTDVVPDVYAAQWHDTCRFTLVSGGTFGFEVWDRDPEGDANVLAFDAQDDTTLLSLVRRDVEPARIVNDHAELVVTFDLEP